MQYPKGLALLCFLFLSIVGYAQSPMVSGRVLENVTNEPLPGVDVTLEGTTFVTQTDGEGKFDFGVLELDPGESYVILRKNGYVSKRMDIILDPNNPVVLDPIYLSEDISDQELQIGVISLSDNDLDSDDTGIENVSGLLSASRDVFLRAAAFDFSATFFRPRGLDNERGKVLINGLEMNRLQNGRPQWSNWGGVNDLQRNQEFTMGLAANEYTFGGLSGVTNINMRASRQRQGGRVSYAASNRSYNGRVMASYNSGKTKSGWSYSAIASRRFGEEGYIDGTFYDANSFAASVEKEINDDHSLNLTYIYTPNRRGRSTAITQEVFDLKGRQYNPFWGFQDGEKRNSRTREIEEPILMLNHYWQLTDKTQLNTNIGYQWGHVGNSRIDNGGTRQVVSSDGQSSYVGGGRNIDPSYYQNLPSYFLRFPDDQDFAAAYIAQQDFQNDGQINWNELYQANLAQAPLGGNSIYALMEDRIDTDQLMANMLLTSNLTDNVILNAGVNYRNVKQENYALITDLLGGQGFLDVDNFANGANGVPVEVQAQSDVNNPNRIVGEGDRFRYNFEMDAEVIGGFAQGQFFTSLVDFYVAGNIDNTTYQRNGIYENGNFIGNSQGRSEKLDFQTYGVKTGATVKVTGRHLLDFNGTYQTNAPTIRNSFSNSRQNNSVVSGLTEETIYGGDVSYIYRAPKFKARLSAYYMEIQDATEIGFYFVDGLFGPQLNSTNAFVQEIVQGVDRLHQGLEFGAEYQITPTIKLKAAGSFGEMIYSNNPDLYLTSDDFAGELSFGEAALENYHIAGGPQRVAQLGFEYRDPDFWWVGSTVNGFSHGYLDVSPLSRTLNFTTDADGQTFNDYDPAIARDLLRQERFNDYMLVNVVGGKSWKIDDYFIGFFATINNVFDEVYRTGGFEQARNANYRTLLVESERETPIFGPRYFYGFGRTYYLNVYMRF